MYMYICNTCTCTYAMYVHVYVNGCLYLSLLVCSQTEVEQDTVSL